MNLFQHYYDELLTQLSLEGRLIRESTVQAIQKMNDRLPTRHPASALPHLCNRDKAWDKDHRKQIDDIGQRQERTQDQAPPKQLTP
jgi:hypothetical protein